MTQTSLKENDTVSAAKDLPENGQEDRTYFEEECSSAWYVIETVIQDVLEILRTSKYPLAALCLTSAFDEFSSLASFATDEVRDGDCGEFDRDKIHLELVRDSSLEYIREEVSENDLMLRFLLEGMNSKRESVEQKRAKAIKYTCDELSISARGLVYHTCGEEE